MGKRIDRLALLCAAVAFFYGLFLRLLHQIPLACAATLLLFAVGRRILRGKALPTRMSRFQAEQLLRSWACESDGEAGRHIATLLGTKTPMVCVLRLPEATLTMNDVFSAWKAHHGEEALTIAATCFADGRARACARTLREPSVTLVDAPVLISRIRASDLPAPESAGLKLRIKRYADGLRALIERRSWLRSAGFGLFLLALYLLGGNPLYLALAAADLLLAGLSLRARRAG